MEYFREFFFRFVTRAEEVNAAAGKLEEGSLLFWVSEITVGSPGTSIYWL